MLANMPYNLSKCTYNSHFLLLKVHVINNNIIVEFSAYEVNVSDCYTAA